MKTVCLCCLIGGLVFQSPGEESSRLSSVSLSLTGIGKSSVSPGEASYEASLSEIEIQHGYFRGAYKVFQFDWSGTLPGQQRDVPPWEHLMELNLGLGHDGRWGEKVAYSWMLGGQAAFEREMSDSVTPLGFGMFQYSLRPNLSMLAGLFASRHPQVRSDYDLVPLLAVHWQPDVLPSWQLQVGLPQTSVRWSVTDETTLRVELTTMEGGVYRLENDTNLMEARYVEFDAASVGIHLDRPVGPVDLSVGVFLPFDRSFTLYDRDGDKLRSFDVERRPAASLTVCYDF